MKNDSKGYEICSAGFYCPEGTGSDLRPCKAGNGALETDTTLRAEVLFSHHAAEYVDRASQVCPHSHISLHSRFIRFNCYSNCSDQRIHDQHQWRLSKNTRVNYHVYFARSEQTLLYRDSRSMYIIKE